jgi:type 1 glutamine amidotransferase
MITRREMLKWSAMFAGTMCVGSSLRAADDKPIKLLYFTKSSGFQHSVITRKGDDLAFSEKIMVDLGKKNGFDITPSKDGSLFTAEKLAEFDGFIFYTTGDLTTTGTDKQPAMPADGKQVLLDAIAGGKAFIGLHCASDTFHGKGNEIDPFIAMVGGEFVVHGKEQISTSKIMDPRFPGVPGKDFSFKEEWYTQKNFASDLHVILQQQTDGMEGAMYKRPPYPSSWARNHGKGKVFYTSMGHREDVWTNPIFTDLLMGGISWATGKAAAEIPVNMK